MVLDVQSATLQSDYAEISEGVQVHVLGLIIGICFLEWGFVLGGSAAYSLDLPTLSIVVGAALGFTHFGHRGHLWAAIRAGLSGKAEDADARAQHAQVLQTLRSAFIGSGIATALIGGINMSRGLDDMSEFGPAFSVLLLAPFYGVVFGELVVIPAMHRLQTDVGTKA